MNGKRVDLHRNPIAGVTDVNSLMSDPIVDSGQREIAALGMSYSYTEPDALSDANHGGIANGGNIPSQSPQSTLCHTFSVVNLTAQGDNSTASMDRVKSALTGIMGAFGCSPENEKVKWIVEGQRVRTLDALLHGTHGELRNQLQVTKEQKDEEAEMVRHLENRKREFEEIRDNMNSSLRARIKVEPVIVHVGWRNASEQ